MEMQIAQSEHTVTKAALNKIEQDVFTAQTPLHKAELGKPQTTHHNVRLIRSEQEYDPRPNHSYR